MVRNPRVIPGLTNGQVKNFLWTCLEAVETERRIWHGLSKKKTDPIGSVSLLAHHHPSDHIQMMGQLFLSLTLLIKLSYFLAYLIN